MFFPLFSFVYLDNTIVGWPKQDLYPSIIEVSMETTKQNKNFDLHLFSHSTRSSNDFIVMIKLLKKETIWIMYRMEWKWVFSRNFSY